METLPEVLQPALTSLFAVDSIWSVILRGAIWLAVSVVIIISMDAPNQAASQKNLKANLGFFLLFIVLTGGLIYLLFGYTRA